MASFPVLRLALIPGLLIMASCSSSTSTKKSAEQERQASAPAERPAAPEQTAATYRVRFDTSKGPFVVEVHPDWAPLGAARFQELIQDGYYNGARFFRVVPNFVVQFGLAANPAMTKKWDKPIKDDEVKQTNRTGSLAFATMGPETRTAQVFINLKSNQTLDSQGFAPFAIVVEGMDVVRSLHSGYGEAPDQDAITRSGNSYLQSRFPRLDYIKTATIL